MSLVGPMRNSERLATRAGQPSRSAPPGAVTELPCSGCGEVRHLDEFWMAGPGKNPGREGRQSRCKACMRKDLQARKRRKRQTASPEARNLANRRRYEARKRRMAKDPDYRRREYRRQAEAKRKRKAKERAGA